MVEAEATTVVDTYADKIKKEQNFILTLSFLRAVLNLALVR